MLVEGGGEEGGHYEAVVQGFADDATHEFEEGEVVLVYVGTWGRAVGVAGGAGLEDYVVRVEHLF